MMDCLCVVGVEVTTVGQRVTKLKSRGFCGGNSVSGNVKKVSYISMGGGTTTNPPNPPTLDVPTYLNLQIPEINQPQ